MPNTTYYPLSNQDNKAANPHITKGIFNSKTLPVSDRNFFKKREATIKEATHKSLESTIVIGQALDEAKQAYPRLWESWAEQKFAFGKRSAYLYISASKVWPKYTDKLKKMRGYISPTIMLALSSDDEETNAARELIMHMVISKSQRISVEMAKNALKLIKAGHNPKEISADMLKNKMLPLSNSGDKPEGPKQKILFERPVKKLSHNVLEFIPAGCEINFVGKSLTDKTILLETLKELYDKLADDTLNIENIIFD